MFSFKREKGGHGEYMVTAVFSETLVVSGAGRGKGLKHMLIHLAVSGGAFVAALRFSRGAWALERVDLAAPQQVGLFLPPDQGLNSSSLRWKADS